MLSGMLRVVSLPQQGHALSATKLHQACWSMLAAVERGREHCHAERSPACVVRRHNDPQGV